MNDFDLKGGADAAWALVTDANQYIVRTAPWALAKEARDDELDDVLASLARCLYRLAVLAAPFIPGKAEALWRALGRTDALDAGAWNGLATPPVAGDRTTKPPVLFPKPELIPQ
jgi:methionyl-tRNA synthetase